LYNAGPNLAHGLRHMGEAGPRAVARRPATRPSNQRPTTHSIRVGEGGAESLTHETQTAVEERRRREARGLTWERNGVGQAHMNSGNFDLFNRISN
jgi:hypothetical protein